jgi:flagellar P-ring protein precursor FlgI
MNHVFQRAGSLLLAILLLPACVFCAEAPPQPVNGVRIKDLADILGVRDNQLVGQGLVVGLEGTGDKTGVLASQELSNILSRMGVSVPASSLKPKNIAVVAITAQLPPFSRKGAKIDVQVSSISDASSLQGGILLQAPLQGADGRVYAVAQGSVSIGGFNVSSGGGGGTASVQKNHTLVGRIPNGALIEREVSTNFEKSGVVSIILRKSDFTTAQRMAEAVNGRWKDSARATDPHTVEFLLPEENPDKPETSRMAVISELEAIRFAPDVRARVVINERTGTIVAGAEVRLIPTVLSHGNLYITIKNTLDVSQPGPFSAGTTAVTNDGSAKVTEEKFRAVVLETKSATLGDLASALNSLKVTPRDIISIFQALKEAGALNAELVIL